MHIDGACHCGAISFTAEIDPTRVMLCHCADCQVLSGSPYRHVVPAETETFKLVGEVKRYVKVADSGNLRVQAFCPECGTPIYSSATESPAWVSIRLGGVRQRAQLKPSSQIWYHSAMPWLPELSSVPSSPEQQAILAALPQPGSKGQSAA
jgi:hypothetical protein